MNQLVSVIVITYNSSEFVIETLKSIQQQTYKNIELIISDDCSKDSTVEMCEDWLLQNKNRFVTAKIISAEKNTGISANLKRGVDSCNGEWIKIIAGDDLLINNCIENYINELTGKDIDWAVSRMDKLADNKISAFTSNQDSIINFFRLKDSDKVRYYVLNPIFLNPPSGFYRTSVLQQSGIIDDTFSLLEDQPIFLNLLKKEYKGIFLNLPTVIYRINQLSITATVNVNFYKNLERCYFLYRKPNIPETFLGILYKKSIEKRFNWLINSYSAKNKFEIVKISLWDKLNNFLATIIFKTNGDS